MPTASSLAALLIAAPLIATASIAGAETPPPAPPPEVRAVMNGDQVVRLTTAWETGARLKLDKKKATRLAKAPAAGTLISGHGVIVCAVATTRSAPFRVHVVSGGKVEETAKLARPGKRDDNPFAVIGTATPDGFTVFFQEVQTDDPSAAHTYMAKLDKKGASTGKAVEVGVPWALADAIWNGAGYHLALFFPGDANGMRLSMVSLSEAGAPQQHPDWASAAGFIADVHLWRDDDGKTIKAFYRGGGGGESLLESDVTAIRGWGSEPPKAKRHGKLSLAKTIVVTASGKAKAVTR